MDTLVQDIRFGARTLLKNRAFTVTAVLTLALGIGGNTAIFSVVNGVLLRPLPYADPERLMVVWNDNRREGIAEDITSYPNFSDWRSQADAFEGMTAFRAINFNIAGETPEQIRGAQVSADFFGVFGVPAALGRRIEEPDMEPGRHQVVTLSHGLWTRHFGADAGIVGQTVELSGQPYTVIGVMPPGFAFPADAEFWVPLSPAGPMQQAMQGRGSLWLSVIGRLRGDVTVTQAQVQMDAVAERLEREYPDANNGLGIRLEPLHAETVGAVRPALLVLLGAVGFVLLIACANVASLLLARATARHREVSIRLALGAERGRIIRQMLTESVMLGVAGGTIGAVLAWWGVGALVAARPADIPRLDGVQVNGAVLAFTLGLSMLTGTVFGLVPALNASRPSLVDALKDGGRADAGSERMRRVRPVLIMAEIALAVVLLVGAGLLIRSFAKLQSVDPGFRSANLLTARIPLAPARYGSPEQVSAFYEELLQRAEALQGVESAGAVSTLFLSRLPNMGPIAVQGVELAEAVRNSSVVNDAATPGFFEALGAGVVHGRTFDGSERRDGPTQVVVNEALVRRYFGGRDPLTMRITYDNPDGDEVTWYEVIGVIADLRRSGLAEEVRPEMYFSHAQATRGSMLLVMRTSGDPLAVVPGIREAVRSIDPEQPIAQIGTVEKLLSDSVATRRFIMALLVAFAAAAVGLATLGTYGVMAYLVTQRTREMGVRVALGAATRDVLSLVLSEAFRYVVPGLLIGLSGAVMLTRFLESQLYRVSATDPLTFVVVAALLSGIALLASYVPAKRAAAVDPAVALRFE